jgi:hypothetical protein
VQTNRGDPQVDDECTHHELRLKQSSKDVGKVTAFTLKWVSKDNFVFGVASVNATGQASLPVFPQPVR